MEKETLPRKTRAERIESTRTVTVEDLRHLHELEILKLPPPDRNYVVALSQRDIEDKQTSNRKRQEEYLQDNLGIEPGSLTLNDGTPMKRSLVTETLFSWISAVHAIEKSPEREQQVIDMLNETIRLQDKKREYVDSDAIGELTAHGFSFFRNKLSLPPGALQVMWKKLESSL